MSCAFYNNKKVGEKRSSSKLKTESKNQRDLRGTSIAAVLQVLSFWDWSPVIPPSEKQ